MPRCTRRVVLLAAAAAPAALSSDPSLAAPAGDDSLRRRALEGLRRAAAFFRTRVAAGGGYLWRYSEDLKLREGEGKAGAATIWVQPPGTPSVGMAYFTAYEATGEQPYLDAARAAAGALIRGQLRSGGWDYRIELDAGRNGYAYRGEPAGDTRKNVTTFDDDTTQAALRLLIRVDRTLGFRDESVHEAATYALESILKAQYPNGAWPQRYDRFPEAGRFPVRKASFPDTWPRAWPNADYRSYYTFNDRNLDRLVDTLLQAARTYDPGAYRKAVVRAGEFILLAWMPEPQPAWAQQYDVEMHPAWARKFEPPAVTGGESQGALQTLLTIYRETGERRFLEPIPAALEYLRRSRLPDGRLARFYELRTNRPLYFTRDYRLVYTADDLPTHYAFKVSDGTDRIARDYERVKAAKPETLKPRLHPLRGYPGTRKPARPPLTPALEARVRAVLDTLDDHGRWVEDGRLRYHGPDDPTRRIIDSETFIRNAGILSEYLAATRP